MKRQAFVLSLAVTACSAAAGAEDTNVLGPEVRKYLRVGAPKIVLEHVEVIDGTGAAPVPDRNVVIEGGKIAAITAGADQPPSDGTAVLDLRGHSGQRLVPAVLLRSSPLPGGGPATAAQRVPSVPMRARAPTAFPGGGDG